MQINLTKKDLIDFEKRIAKLWEEAKIPYYVHLSGGNEEQLIKIFKRIKVEDYVFSTHRSHYHYLLKGGSSEDLEKKILNGESMHVINKNINFISTSIVAGGPAIAVGIAYALKQENSKRKVWCFVGDGAEDEGHFYEAVRYVDGQKLPCVFVIEDNNRSVETTKIERYGKSEIQWPKCVIRYHYKSTTLHAGTDKFVNFGQGKIGSTM
jgi:TPP-dependent pyruvate/acetoin dehydrogenase alpha subunit